MDLVNESGFAPAWLTWKIRPPAWTLTVVAKGTFDLATGAPSDPLPAEGDVLEGEELRYAHDFAPIKPKVDVLLVGSGHSPGDTDVFGVTLAVGRWSKRLAVLSKEPRVPLTWSSAKRGLVVYRERTEEVACFAPIPQTWPERKKKMGPNSAYGKSWLKTRWPWWPEEFDWGYYNAAPEDQQIERLAGDEEILLENLVPKQSPFRARLPGVRARAFVLDEAGFHEVPMSIDTLWIDSDAGRLVLIWRGQREVRSEKLKEIKHLYLVREPLAGPALSRDDYRKKLEESLKPKEEEPAPVVAPAPEPPPPPEPQEPPELEAEMEKYEKQIADAEKEAERLLAEAQQKTEEAAKQAGVVLPKGPAPMPKPEEIVAMITNSLLDAKAKIIEAGQPVPPGLQKMIDAPPKATDFEIPEIKEPEIPEPASEPPPPPPPPTRDEVAARREEMKGADLAGIDLSGLDLSNADFRGAILKDADLSKSNLAGADLSGAVLAKANLSGADLRGANLAAAEAGEANLEDANLTEAHLEEAVLTGAKLARANLALADATEADLSNADLRGAELRQARLARANLSEAVLDGVRLDGANLSGARMTGARAAGLVADGADCTEFRASGAKLEGASFKKARADGSIWEGANLAGANFSFAKLKGAEFSETNLEGAILISANVPGGRFTGANLRRADLTRANLFRGSVEKADLTGAIFAEANLFEAETWDAVLDGADFRGANVQRTKLAMRD